MPFHAPPGFIWTVIYCSTVDCSPFLFGLLVSMTAYREGEELATLKGGGSFYLLNKKQIISCHGYRGKQNHAKWRKHV